MFSPHVPSPSNPASSHPRPFNPTSRSLSVSSTASILPTGGCQFILLHPSIPDQRCLCQGFRRNESLPGAHCECGHQACYHSQGNAAQLAAEDHAVPSVSYLAMVDKIQRLEAQQEHDRKVWEEELKEERRARREDIRVLREAMYSFYKFMEQDIPQKFDDVEDKIEGVVDRQQQLQERVITVDDSTMALEDRVAGLEHERDPNDRDEDDDKEEDDNDFPGQKRARQCVNKATSAEVSTVTHSLDCSPLHADMTSEAASRSYKAYSCASPTSISSPTSSPPGNNLFSCELANAESMSATAPAPGGHGQYQILASSQDMAFPIVSRTTPERRLCVQSVLRGESSTVPDCRETFVKSDRASSTSSDDPDSSPSPLLYAFSSSSHSLLANKQTQLKRKRYTDEYQMQESATETRYPFVLPNPPPLSLSNADQGPARCHIRGVYRAHNTSSCSSLGLTH